MQTPLPSRVPLFPLPATVLFPQIPLPLHVFEPRYRSLMADALAGDRVIGMVMLKPGFEAEYEGRPPIYAVGCAGVIAKHEVLPDGRYNLILTGMSRFRVISENHERAYRLAEVEYLAEAETPTAETAALRENVLTQLRALAKADGVALHELPTVPPQGVSDYEFANFLSYILAISPLEKQALLEESGLDARLRKLEDILQFARLGRERGVGRAQ